MSITRKAEWEYIRQALASLQKLESDRTLVEQMNEKLAGTRYERSGGPMFSTVQKVVPRDPKRD